MTGPQDRKTERLAKISRSWQNLPVTSEMQCHPSVPKCCQSVVHNQTLHTIHIWTAGISEMTQGVSCVSPVLMPPPLYRGTNGKVTHDSRTKVIDLLHITCRTHTSKVTNIKRITVSLEALKLDKDADCNAWVTKHLSHSCHGLQS